MIDINDVIEIHNSIIDKTGGMQGLRDIGLLESALQNPFQKFNEQSLYKTTIEKASKLLEGIIRNHPFVDGNK
jgi:death-on-curing protein